VLGPPRSSQTNTHPDEMALRSSVSNRLVIIGSTPRFTAWNILCASAGVLMRIPVQVGRCMGIAEEGGRTSEEDQVN
jgi:hypothetical protein